VYARYLPLIVVLPCAFAACAQERPGVQAPPVQTRPTLTTTAAVEDAQPDATMLRYPDVSATHVVFVYANDIWLVPREGGLAVPLASPPGAESFPRFSDDGRTIAFVGNYDGDRDLYTVPVTGGVPHRVTYHPAGELLCGWTPDGQLLFSTRARAGLPRLRQLATGPPAGGLPTKLRVP
jgi:tricorn protease